LGKGGTGAKVYKSPRYIAKLGFGQQLWPFSLESRRGDLNLNIKDSFGENSFEKWKQGTHFCATNME